MQKLIAPSLIALSTLSLTAGTFNVQPLTGDADSGISGNNAYSHAIDMGDGGNRTINGAVFTGSGGGGNPGTNNYSTTQLPNVLSNWPVVAPPGALVSGATGGLFTNFNYGGVPSETLTLNNLRIGQEYTTTFYNANWGGPRSQNISTSDGGAITFDGDATSGSLLKYTFTAASNSLTYTFAPNQPASFHHYAFSNQVAGQKALLTDNFFAPGNPNTNDLNFNLAARQGGSLVTSSGLVSWVASGNTQVGNATGGIDSGNYLLNAFFNGVSALDYNFNGSASAGGLSISFDMSPNSTANGDTSNWEAINIGQSSADKNGTINGGHGHFGILFRGNGGIQAFDGNSVVSGAETWTGLTNVTNDLHHIELLITDPTDANPFDGIGQTDIAVFADGNLKYNFSKTGGGYADNYLNFSNSFIGGVDNLVVSQLVPEPGSVALSGLAALALAGRRRRSR